MVLVLLFAVAAAAGALVARWWLLLVPIAMMTAVAIALVIPGTTIGRDNPLLFLGVLLELGVAAGIAGRKLAVHRPAAL